MTEEFRRQVEKWKAEFKEFMKFQGVSFMALRCVACCETFVCNPKNPPAIPSDAIKGYRLPICRKCLEATNAQRKKDGREIIVFAPDAYGAEHFGGDE